MGRLTWLTTVLLASLAAPAAGAVTVLERRDRIEHVSMAATPAGGALVVVDEAGADAAPGELRSILLDAAGRPLGPAHPIGASAAPSARPDVAADPRGGFAVAWDRERGGDQATVRRLDAAGAPAGEPMPFGETHSPALAAVGTEGDFLMAAQHGPAVYVHVVPAGAAIALAPTLITERGADADIAVDPATRRVLVVWVAPGPEGRDEVFGRTLDAQLRPEGEAVQLTRSAPPLGDRTDQTIPGGAGGPAVAAPAGGDGWLLAWFTLERTGRMRAGGETLPTGSYRLQLTRLAGRPAPVGGAGPEPVRGGSEETRPLRRAPRVLLSEERGSQIVAASASGEMASLRFDAGFGSFNAPFPLVQRARSGAVASGSQPGTILTAWSPGAGLLTRLAGPRAPDVRPPRVRLASVRLRSAGRIARVRLRCDEACAFPRAALITGRSRRVRGLSETPRRRAATLVFELRRRGRGCTRLRYEVLDRERNRRAGRLSICLRA